jgi:CMP-N-acetylneuraminic acid synthetase
MDIDSREKIIGVVCARKGSKRLPLKNSMEIGGVSLGERAYDTLDSVCDRVVMVTDIAKFLESNMETIYRPPFISGDHIPLQNTVKWACNKIYGWYSIIVVLMPNCPMITSKHVEKCINLLRNKNLKIVRSYNRQGCENGLIVMDSRYFIKHWIDVYAGAIVTKGKEIHTQEDFDEVKEIMEGK